MDSRNCETYLVSPFAVDFMTREKRQEQFDPLQKAYKERVVTGFGDLYQAFNH